MWLALFLLDSVGCSVLQLKSNVSTKYIMTLLGSQIKPTSYIKTFITQSGSFEHWKFGIKELQILLGLIMVLWLFF